MNELLYHVIYFHYTICSCQLNFCRSFLCRISQWSLFDNVGFLDWTTVPQTDGRNIKNMNSSEEKYKKYKTKVKLWERDFRKRENRAPSKDDIKLAPQDVREAYKRYWLVKTSILEETILDEETVSTDENACGGNNDVVSNEVTKEESCLVELSNMNSVWGDHLKKVVEKSKEIARKSSSTDFTEKLFKGIKLKMKNPKKFSFRKQKSRLHRDESTVPENSLNNISDDSAEPLSKQNDVSNIHTTSETVKENEIDEENDSLSGFSGIKVVENKIKVSAQPVNILQIDENALNSRESNFKTKLNEGWLQRCHQKCAEDISTIEVNRNRVPDRRIGSAAPEEKSERKNSVSKLEFDEIKTKTDEGISSGDDYVYSSDDETLSKLKSVSESMGQIISRTKSGKKRPGEELSKPNKKRKTLTKDEEIQERKLKTLQEKLDSGTADDNFVKIDLKKKRYARGKTTMTSTKYKVQQWKAKKKINSTRANSNAGGIVLKCFRCGDVGHFMRACKKKDALLPLEEEEEDDSPFPTLEEAAAMVKEKQSNAAKAELETMLESNSAELDLEDDRINCIPALYECEKDGSLKSTPEEVFEALNKFGYESFRTGQENAVMRILSGKSTLVIAGTGSGKSLCYQLPAYLYAQKYNCITLVISPLVSLMEDQILNFPACLKAACLHANQTAQVREKIVKKLENNEIAVLLVSPEAVISGDRGILGQILGEKFPNIAFVCIDEVHCVSQWSHNFRTSYLMICKILRERYNIKTFLGLTATASRTSIACVTKHLGIDDDSGILQEDILPDNLILSVSKDESKDAALLSLLKEPPFSEFDSIIIYCLRRNECETLASFLRTSLQHVKKKLPLFGERSSISCDVEVYHAGISAAKRKRVQNHFIQGKLRIIVATVAFGMGINKADIRGIIHYNMPRTFEHYVQEIGRAGRDGLLARCHLLYDREANDLPELKRHIYRDSLDRPTVRKLLGWVFPRCSCQGTCRKHEVAFSVEDTISHLDLAQENISTLLCYLELLPEKIVEVLPVTYTRCTIVSYNGFIALKRAARKSPVLAFAIAAHRHNTKQATISNKLEFSVTELADKIGWECRIVKRELKRCEWTQIGEKWKKTGIGVTFHDLGFHVRSPGNLTDEQLDHISDSLYNRVTTQERIALYQLKMCDQAFSSAAYDNIHEVNESEDLHERDENLKKIVRSYFIKDVDYNDSESVEINISENQSVINSIHRLVSTYRDQTFTARAIARIFHGIESPNFPAFIWGKTPFWRCALDEDFNAVYRLACRELLKFR